MVCYKEENSSKSMVSSSNSASTLFMLTQEKYNYFLNQSLQPMIQFSNSTLMVILAHYGTVTTLFSSTSHSFPLQSFILFFYLSTIVILKTYQEDCFHQSWKTTMEEEMNSFRNHGS